MPSSPSPVSLADLGWNAWFESHRGRLLPHHSPARVLAEHRGALHVHAEAGTFVARLGGRLRHAAASRLDMPAVGDWVGARLPPGDGDAVVDVVLPRLTCLTRQAAGRRVEAQVVGANVDLVVIVSALDQDFNARRLERWARLVESSGALPLVLLNKADLCADPSAARDAAALAVPGARVLVASAAHADGLQPLRDAVRPGVTAALVGSSGVGKSTTVNALLGFAAQQVLDVREHDHRGRHATTHRELFLLEGGGMLVDTPGLREIAAWADAPGGEPGDARAGAGAATDAPSAFADVEDLAGRCRFRDCAHHDEPGCAVRQALLDGNLEPGRLASWDKLRRELAFQARRQDEAAARAERLRWKAVTKSMRRHPKLTR